MRVLETDPSVLYKMGKNKKHKIRKAKENDADDSSEDGGGNAGCPHVSKAVNLAAMRKALLKPTVTFGECSGCSKEPSSKSPGKDLFGSLIEGPEAASAGEEVEGQEATICVCLQCGHQGCDRHSVNKHALKHYKTPHSGNHCIIVNLTTWSSWCYMCDEEIGTGGKIKGCVDYLQKQSGIAKPEPAQASGRSFDSPVIDLPTPLSNSTSGKNTPNTAPVSCVKVKGLSNLGNTCFFNAVMQSMCQTPGLDSMLTERSKGGRPFPIPAIDVGFDSDSSASDDDQEKEYVTRKKSLPAIQTNIGDAGQVTVALLNFIQEMKGGTTRNGIVNPTSLFAQICRKAPRFRGFQQQDSHELLRYLVDSVRTDEIKRGQASILKYFKLPETTNPKKVDEEVKMKVKEYGRQVKHTFLDSMFGGQLASTVKCEECKSISQIFENFLDLSLPVMEEKPQRPNLVLIGKKKDQALENMDEGAGMAASGGGGLDLDAYAAKPSKYQERKNKRLAKKDSKKKLRLQKSQSQDSKEPNDAKADEDVDGGGEGNEEKLEGNHNDPEVMENSLLGAGGGHDCLSPGRQIRSVITPQSSNTSVDSVLCDSAGKMSSSMKAQHEDESGDPSDADVEDNLDNDSSRIHTSYNYNGVQSSSTAPNTISDPSTCFGKNITDLPHTSISNSLHSATDVKLKDCSSLFHPSTSVSIHNSQSLTSTNDLLSQANTEVIPNGNLNKDKLETNAPSCSTSVDNHVVGNLCADMSRVSLNKSGSCSNRLSGVDGASISCEVSIANGTEPTQIVELANGLGRLTVHESETTSAEMQEMVNSGDVTVTLEENVDNCNGNTESHVSADFTITLPENTNNHRSIAGISNDKNLTSELATNGSVSSSHLDRERGDDASEEMSHKEPQTEDVHHSRDIKHVPHYKSQQESLKEARSCSLNTLAPRYHPASKECSILSCLNQFVAAELLTGSNKFGCKECTRRRRHNSKSKKPPSAEKKTKDTVYSNASKQYLIFRPPAILTLHLKRFEQTGLTSRKVNRHVDFPLLLDLAPYCSALSLGVSEKQNKVLYSLYAVVEHSGRLSGGHYTAYIKVRPGLTSQTEFLHTQPPSPHDLLNVYLNRIAKCKETNEKHSDMKGQDIGSSATSANSSGLSVDHDLQACVEALVPPGRWFHISDSRVNEVTEAVVLKAQAYLLFYERIF